MRNFQYIISNTHHFYIKILDKSILSRICACIVFVLFDQKFLKFIKFIKCKQDILIQKGEVL